MPALYTWLFTAVGLAKRAAAEAGGAPINMVGSLFLVGDGGGVDHTAAEILANGGLYNQVWSGAINRVYQHPIQNNLVVIEALIPPEDGGWTGREAAIKDAAGDVILVGNYYIGPKPAPGSGSEKEIMVRGGMRISNGGDTVIQIDASLVMATQEYVDRDLTLSDVAAPTGDTGTPTTLLGWLANRIKAITGKASWRTAPATTLEATAAHIAASAPHAGHINHSLATAVNDFLVASGVGVFVKKTLAETLAILGFVLSVGTNGYVRFPLGLIVQWGSQTVTGTNQSSHTFIYPTTFPNNVFNIIMSSNSGGIGTGVGEEGARIDVPSLGSATWIHSWTGTGINQAFRFLIIGN